MNCKKYLSLTPMEKSLMIGQVIHCIQNDAKLFSMAKEMIKLGEQKGLFEGVKFMPEKNEIVLPLDIEDTFD